LTEIAFNQGLRNHPKNKLSHSRLTQIQKLNQKVQNLRN